MTIELTPTIKKILMIVLQAVLVITVTAVIAYVVRNQINRNSSQLFNNRLTVLANQSQQERIIRLEEHHRMVMPYLDALYRLTPTQENLVAFRRAVDMLPTASGVAAASLQFDQGEPVSAIAPFRKTTFSIVVSGSLDRFFTYLELLENLPFLITITSLNATSGGGGLTTEAQFTITGELYIR